MGIRIEKINAKGVGPVGEFVHSLGSINLIYGKNERGKTFLVEFLLKSLFKNIKKYNLRGVSSTGNVILTGLETGESQFSPSSRKKMEDFWDEAQPGLPTNIAQLLVVKGADLNFSDDIPCGISKSVVKDFLSSEQLLDRVQGKISKTVQAAQIENGEIIGASRGVIKTRNDPYKKFEQAEQIINQVAKDYSSGLLNSLLNRKEDLNKKIEEQENAKLFLAYSLRNKISELKKENSFLEDRGLIKLKQLFSDLCDSREALEREEAKLKDAKEESVHYEWITAAIDVYDKLLDQGLKPPNRAYQKLSLIMFYLSVLLTIIGLVLHGLNYNPIYFLFFIGIGVTILLGLFFGVLYSRKQIIQQSQFAKSSELKRLGDSYFEKCGEKLTDNATLKNRQKCMEESHYRSKHLTDEIRDQKKVLTGIEKDISEIFERLGFKELDPSSWKTTIEKMCDKYDQNKDSIKDLNLRNAALDVDPDQVLSHDPQIDYDKDALIRLGNELVQVNDSITEEENSLDLLKTEIRTLVSDRSNKGWVQLLEKLNNYRDDQLTDYKEITSKILAGIVVSQVIDEIRSLEDEKLQAALSTEQIQKPLYDVTKRYKHVSLDGSNLLISDKYESFNIDDLSTGAREQVLLALRLGFAARIMKGETAFLILDDAFQHSDWDRREYLLQTVLELTKSGWQIIYFTMDDHIMHLFNETCKKHFESEYRFIKLE